MAVLSEKVDLHMHTSVSDGTDAPESVPALVKAAGIGLFSVTDHDSYEGCERIRDVLTDSDPAFLTGVEFSCKDEKGQYHILGYGFDPKSGPIRQVVETGRFFRRKKLRARLEHLETAFGIRFPEEEIRELEAMDSPGKPHLANLMLRHGYAATREEAFGNFLNRVHFASEYVSPREAIEGILESGGIPVLAHPAYGNGDALILGEEMDGRLRRLTEFGLRGVEAFYSGFSVKICRETLSFADRYGLCVTAGSDYHGKNKIIALGDTGPLEEDAPRALRRFLREAEEKVING